MAKIELPPINWFGGYLVAREVLQWTKSAQDPDSADSFIAKMNRPNWIQRATAITSVLNLCGPTLEAARLLQSDGKGFFTDVSDEALTEQLTKACETLAKGGLWKFSPQEFGSLDFSGVPGSSEAEDL